MKSKADTNRDLERGLASLTHLEYLYRNLLIASVVVDTLLKANKKISIAPTVKRRLEEMGVRERTENILRWTTR